MQSTLDIYTRVSRVGDRDATSERFGSVDEQVEQCRSWCAENGCAVGEVFTDLDESGGTMRRPMFDVAMRRALSGESDGIVVAYLSRFGRTTVGALSAISDIDKAGGRFVSKAEGIDTRGSSALAGFFVRFFAALAELERDRTSESWTTSKGRAIERGVYISAKPPTGYDRDEDGRLTPNELAPHIARLFALRADGASWRECSEALTAAGVLTTTGLAHWSHVSMGYIIKNPAYLGHNVHGGTGTRRLQNGHTSRQSFSHHDSHEPLVDRATWEAANARNGKSGRRANGTTLLAGIIVCGGCSYAASPAGRGTAYRCSWTHREDIDPCTAPAQVQQHIVDAYVEETVLADLAGRLTGEDTSADSLAPLADAVAQAESDLLAFRGNRALLRSLGPESFAAEIESLVRDLNTARHALSSARQAITGNHDSPRIMEAVSAWRAGALSLDDKRDLLASVLDAVVLRKSPMKGAGGPIADRVDIVYRGDAPSWLRERRSASTRPYPARAGVLAG